MLSDRAYGKVYRAFWTDPEMHGLTTGQKLLLLYYFTSPHGNMIGLYYCSFGMAATEVKIDVHSVKRWTLGVLAPWVTYDIATSEILVHNGARVQVGETLLPTDQRWRGVLRQLAAARSAKLREMFHDLYADWRLAPERDVSLANGLPLGVARSIERNQTRRARELGVRHEAVDLHAIFNAHAGCCALCGEHIAVLSELSFDHIVPLTKGGEHRASNIQLAHKACNSSKGTKMQGASKDPHGTLKGPSKPGAVAGSSSSSRSSSRSRTTTVASQPAAPNGDLTDGQLMGFVRQHLYVTDGKAPKGYDDGRDVKIIRALRKCGLTGYQIADAIEGVRLMCEAGELGRKRPGEKLTMRALYNTGHGVRPLLYQAQECVYKRQNQRPDLSGSNDRKSHAPEHIGAALERVVPRKP